MTTKLIAFEAAALILFAVAFMSYISYGGWDHSAQPIITSFNNSFWDLSQTYPALNMNVTNAGNSTINGIHISYYDVLFNSQFFNGSTIVIHGLLLVPPGSNLPCLLMLPGAGSSSSDLLPLANDIASGGYVVMAMDSPGSGNSTGPSPTPESITNFENGPFSSYYYLNVISASRAVTALGTLAFVNSSEIAVAGVSQGGIASFILSSIDNRIKANIPILASGYFDENVLRGSLFSFQLPSNASVSSAEFAYLVSYFDCRSYAPNIGVPTLMLEGTNDPYFLLTQVNNTFNDLPGQPISGNQLNQTYSILPLMNTINIAPNQSHAIAGNWNTSILLFLNYYFKGSPTVPLTPHVANVVSANFDSALNVSSAPLFIDPIPSYYSNYSTYVFYRYSIPGSSWTGVPLNDASASNLASSGSIPLPALPTNVEYFLALVSNGTVISTSAVFQTWTISSYFIIIVVFLVLAGLILAINWREAITAYISSDLRSTIFFIVGMALWLLAAVSLTMPWIDIPGKASLNAMQIWDRFPNMLPGIYILFALILIAIAGFAVRMWAGGIILLFAGALMYFSFIGLFSPFGAVSYAWGAYLFGGCIAAAFIITALEKIVKG